MKNTWKIISCQTELDGSNETITAMEITGVGCAVKVTTTYLIDTGLTRASASRNADTIKSTAVTHAIANFPGVCIKGTAGSYTLEAITTKPTIVEAPKKKAAPKKARF